MRSVTAAAADSRSIAAVSGSTSANRGIAPVAHTAAAVGHRGEGGHDHLVTGTDAERNQREPQRVGAGRDGDGVAPADERRELGLERFGLGPEEVPPRSHDARDRLRQLGLERRRPPSEVDDRDPRGRGHTYHERRER